MPDIVTGAMESGADLVAVSVLFPAADDGVRAALKQLRATLPVRLSLLVGGAAAASYADVLPAGSIVTGGLPELRRELRSRLPQS